MKKEGWTKLAVKSLTYILSRTLNGQYVFEAFCGGIAITHRSFILNDEEASEYESEGEAFLDRLHRDVSWHYEKYQPRLISIE